VIVHHPGRLHHRVADRRSHELESAREQISAHRIRLGRARRNLLHRPPLVNPRPPADKAPYIFVEAVELFLNGKKRFCVADRGIDLQPIANDAGIREEPRDVTIAELRHERRLELLERASISGALAQNRVPAKARLRAFERYKLEPKPIVMHRHAPLLIVIANRQLIARPITSHLY